FEELLERSQGCLYSWVEQAVPAAIPAGMEHREDDGDVRILAGAGGSVGAARAVEVAVPAPQAIEESQRLLRCDATGAGRSVLTARLQPIGTVLQRLRLQELGVVVISVLLLPDIAAGLAHAGEGEREVGVDDIAQGCRQGQILVKIRELPPPAQEREAPECRPIGLRPQPADEI